jgi:putative ABC transport system substrate-binding protein
MWPLAAFAQQTAMPVVGYLSAGTPEQGESRAAAFRRGLQESGYVVGQNVAIEYRWAEEQTDRLPALAADLVKRHVTVIATGTTPAVIAAQAATTTIPIVFEMGSDPVRLGLVANLNRPGGNVTGVTNLIVEVTPKRLELLHELIPAVKVMALLVNSADRNLAQVQVREMGSSSVINQKTSPTGSFLLIWCVPPSCQRFSPSASILKLGRSWRTALRLKIIGADLRVTSTRF